MKSMSNLEIVEMGTWVKENAVEIRKMSSVAEVNRAAEKCLGFYVSKDRLRGLLDELGIDVKMKRAKPVKAQGELARLTAEALRNIDERLTELEARVQVVIDEVGLGSVKQK